MSPGKIAAIAGIILLSHIPLQAQWEFGGLLGLNLASISVPTGTSSEDYSSRVGFGIGLVADRPLTDQIILHVEPMFLQKGATVKNSVVTLKYKVNYIELPILFKYAFSLHSSLAPYAMAGPSLGFLTGAKFEDEDGNTQDEKDHTKTLDFGLGLGGGVSIPHGKLTFFAETRYVLGLVNINAESDESAVKNRGLLVLVGVMVPVGPK